MGDRGDEPWLTKVTIHWLLWQALTQCILKTRHAPGFGNVVNLALGLAPALMELAASLRERHEPWPQKSVH